MTLIVLLGLVGLWQLAQREGPQAGVLAPTAVGGGQGAALPLQAQAQIAGALGADDPAYRVTHAPGGFQATNHAAHLRAGFDASGVTVTSGTARLGLQLSAVGYGSALQALRPVSPHASSNRVFYPHAGLTESFTNGPLGLEQGFTVAGPPSGIASGALTLSLSLSGDLQAAAAGHAQSLTFAHAGAPTLHYGSLFASDARGRALPSWLELRGNQLLIRVDTRGARYPLRVDPLIQQARLAAGAEVSGSSRFGFSVALSADGNTALVGAPNDGSEASSTWYGAAWVFVRSGSTWTQQGPKLTGGEEAGGARFGESVALSGDGNTAVIGGSYDNNEVGAAWVFTRSGSTWTQQGPKLTGGGEVGEANFGESVAISADGNTVLTGGDSDNLSEGAAWVFTRSGSTWTQQGPKLTGAGGSGHERLGASVALSADGNTAIVGGSADHSWLGAAWVFTRSGSTWTQQGPKLTGSEEIGEGLFGQSVALSANGNTALVGGGDDGPQSGGRGTGAAWAFTRSGSTWTQQGPKLTGGGEVGSGSFGYEVALANEGNLALIGAPADNGGPGAAWEFTRSGSTWSQLGSKLTAPTESGPEPEFGIDIALSQTGSTAMIGQADNGRGIGAAWVFEATSPAPVEKVEYKNWVLGGTITPARLGQPFTLPAGSSFNGSGELNTETGAGSVAGNISIPPFASPFKWAGVLPVSIGVTLSEAGPLAGTASESETVPGDETLRIPLKLNATFTSLSLLGLHVPINCTTTEPLAFGLVDNLTREALLRKGWQFAGDVSIPRVRCGSGLLGGIFGGVLTILLSGPENPYSISISAPEA